MPRKSSTAPVGIVIGAGVMGSFHAASAANLQQAKLRQRSLKTGKSVAFAV